MKSIRFLLLLYFENNGYFYVCFSVMAKEKVGKKKASGAGVFMNPKTDFGFKKIFGNKPLLLAFLNAMGALPEKIADIEYLPLEQLGIVEENRKAIYDIYVKTESGKRYIVEMQVSRQDHFEERMLLYASYSFIYQTLKGKITTTDAQGNSVARVGYDIAGVCVIAILDFVLFKEKAAKDIAVEQVKLMRQAAKMEFSDKYSFLIIELPKFRKKLDELSTVSDKLLYSLKNMDKLTERPEVMSEDILKRLYEEARINKLTKVDMETYNQSVLEYYDVRQAMDVARSEGRSKGRREGRREGRSEGRREGIEHERIRNVKIFYNELHLGSEQIARLTGLPEERVCAILDGELGLP
jgi:predicted transposase/invertase (TIGR01784 family)